MELGIVLFWQGCDAVRGLVLPKQPIPPEPEPTRPTPVTSSAPPLHKTSQDRYWLPMFFCRLILTLSMLGWNFMGSRSNDWFI